MPTITAPAPLAAVVERIAAELAALDITAPYVVLDGDDCAFVRSFPDGGTHVAVAPLDDDGTAWVVTIDEPHPAPNMPPAFERVVGPEEVAQRVADAVAAEARVRAEHEGRDTWTSASVQHFLDTGVYLWPSRRMWAIPDEQGTAVATSALCARCLADPTVQATARNDALSLGDVPASATWVDATENTELACGLCGYATDGDARAAA